MSGGTKPHQLSYYKEMSEKVDAAKAAVEAVVPGKAEEIFAPAYQEIRGLITRATNAVPLDGDEGDMYGAMHELLLEVEGGNTSAAEKAEAKARELGVQNEELIRSIRAGANAICDLSVTMERDHYDR